MDYLSIFRLEEIVATPGLGNYECQASVAHEERLNCYNITDTDLRHQFAPSLP